MDFCNQLIQRKVERRLGRNGYQELKAHPWLRFFPWKYLLKKVLRPEYVPPKSQHNFDDRNVNRKERPIDHSYVGMLKRKDVQKMFEQYQFVAEKKGEGYLTTRASTSALD